MLGIKYFISDSSTFIIKTVNGKVRKSGKGLSFFYHVATASIAAVPVNAQEAPFIFKLLTADYQTITVQGQITYQVVAPEKTAEILNFSLKRDGRTYVYQFSPSDIVVTIGQDGLVANTLKYLNGQPVIAINPDPDRWDSKLLPFEIAALESVVMRTMADKSASKTITFAEAKTNDGQSMLAVNDLFIGPKSHTSARYLLSWKGHKEIQSSSGIIISTGFGSTGWFQSILAGALAVAGNKSHPLKEGFAWHEQRLQFTVREPFPSHTTGIDLIFGSITPESPLELESFMPEYGVIFSDGIESDFLAFNSGTIASIGLASVQGQLIV